MGWFSRWFSAKPQAMSREALRKREQVLAILPLLSRFMQSTRRHIQEDDLKIPRRFRYFVAYTLGAIRALGESHAFEEGQELAGLLIFLQENSQLDAHGISETIGKCMELCDTPESQQAIQAGSEAMKAWQRNDSQADRRLAQIFREFSGPFAPPID